MPLFRRKNASLPGGTVLQDMTRVPFVPIGDTAINYIQNGYQANADLFTIINLLTSNTPNVKATLYKGDKEIDKHDILTLLDNPSPTSTRAIWLQQVSGYYWLTGNAYIYAPFLEAGVNKGKTVELGWLPSQYMKVKKQKDGRLLYIYEGPDHKKEYQQEEILHLRTPNYEVGAGREMTGMSPIKAALNNLSSSNEGTKAQAARFQNGGLDGILGVKDAQSEPQIKKLKADLKMQSGTDAAGRILVTSSGLDWVRFGLSSADLQILQTVTWNLRTFANIYKIDPKLVDPTVANTYNNMKEAYASMYLRAILPFWRELANGLTHWLLPKYDKGLTLKLDTSDIPELQRDKETQTKWLKDAWWMTGNEKRAEQGMEPMDDPDMDLILYPNGGAMPSDIATEKTLNERAFRDYRT